MVVDDKILGDDPYPNLNNNTYSTFDQKFLRHEVINIRGIGYNLVGFSATAGNEKNPRTFIMGLYMLCAGLNEIPFYYRALFTAIDVV
jgi:hypothetical protein